MGKDKKKKRVKKALKEMPYSASPLGSAATWRIGCQEELSKALDWAAHPSVTLVCGRCLKPIMALGGALAVGNVCMCQSRTRIVWVSFDYATNTGHGVIERVEPERVPNVFQQAFEDGELEP
jgi:hypothetical protein